MPTQLVFWHWWILAAVLIGVEVFVTTTVFLWTGVAAVVVGVALLVMPELGWQAQGLTFAVISVATVLGWWRWGPKHGARSADPTINRRGSEFVGQTFALETAIEAGRGQLMIDGILWRISGPDLAAPQRVTVVGVDGATLRVEPAEVS